MFSPGFFTKALQQVVVFSLLALSTNLSQAQLSINFNFTPQNPTELALSAANQTIFNDAAIFWESNLTGYQDGSSRTVSINATGFNQPAANGGIILGQAGPTGSLQNIFANGQGFSVVTQGNAQFNVNPAALNGGGLLNPEVIRHEIGHILGFGTIFDFGFNDLYEDGTGIYTGANGLAAFQGEFDPNATFVPIELDGGPGTQDGHLNEVTDNFSEENALGFDSDPGDNATAPTVLFGPNAGLSLDDALLSGVLSGNSFLTDTTLGVFQDLGFTTVEFRSIPVPEPSSTLLFVLATGAALSRRRRA